MKIAFITSSEGGDISQWSGTNYFMARSLESAGAMVSLLHPAPSLASVPGYIKKYYYQLLYRKGYHAKRNPFLLKAQGKDLQQQLSDVSYDAIVSPGALPVSNLDSPRPIAIWSDATFASMLDYYPTFSNLSNVFTSEADAIERRAFAKASLLTFSSNWAAQSALEDYGIAPKKVRILPFGANLRVLPARRDLEQYLAARGHDACELLFIGVDWVRKGGAQAVAVVDELQRRGVPAHLTIVGAKPPPSVLNLHYVSYVGFVSKGSADGERRIASYLAKAHFLILPSQAECSAIVYSEASAFGVPSLGTKTGGTESIVKENINGFTFPITAHSADYADKLMPILQNRATYDALSWRTFDHYHSVLSWEVNAKKLISELENVVT